MMFLIRYWRPIAASIATACLAWVLHSLDVSRIENNNRSALAAQQLALEEKCASDKKLTEESSRDYKIEVDALARKLADVKRVRPNHCIMPIAGKASGGDGSATAGKYAGQNGVATDALYDYAGTCERLRIQVSSLQDFIDNVWAGQGR